MKALKITAAVLCSIPLLPFFLLVFIINLTGSVLVWFGEGLDSVAQRLNSALKLILRFGKNIIWGIK